MISKDNCGASQFGDDFLKKTFVCLTLDNFQLCLDGKSGSFEVCGIMRSLTMQNLSFHS